MKNALDFNSRIVGGSNASTPIPWQVLVHDCLDPYCGGTILDEYTILSAAHCNISSNDYILAGAKSSQPGPQTQTIPVKNVTNHPNFKTNQSDGTFTDFDYSIVKLTSPLSFNINVQPACLPTANFDVGDFALASGWGSIKTCKFVFDFNISSFNDIGLEAWQSIILIINFGS